MLPPINLAHSDDENLAKQRSKLAEDTIALVKDVNPLDVYARPPSQTEFQLIQSLYKLEQTGTDTEKAGYIDMSATEVHSNYFMHQQAQN